jgi:hypothetical protein
MSDGNLATIIPDFNEKLLFYIQFIRKLFHSSHFPQQPRHMFLFMTFLLKNVTKEFLSWFYLFYVVRNLNSYYAMYFWLFETLERSSETLVSIFPRVNGNCLFPVYLSLFEGLIVITLFFPVIALFFRSSSPKWED